MLFVSVNEKKNLKYPWYLSWWFIIVMMFGGVVTVGVTTLLGVFLIPLRIKFTKFSEGSLELEAVESLKVEKEMLLADVAKAQKELSVNQGDLAKVKKDLNEKNDVFGREKEAYIAQLRIEFEEEGKKIVQEVIDENQKKVAELQKFADERDALALEIEKMNKIIKSQSTKLLKLKTEFYGAKQFIEIFPTLVDEEGIPVEVEKMLSGYDEESIMKSLVELEYHAMHSKELRKQINRVKKEIAALLDKYKDRYKTKANQTIYQLMVIGLQAELQNVLYTLSYAKHEEALKNASALIRKFLSIASNGNSSIASTISKFLTELEPLFIEAVEIEYQYYIKREQEKEEQRLIREQMKQEAAERKELEAQKKKLEAEESKYQVELERTSELLSNETNPDVIAQLQQRILELVQQQNKVAEEKEEILKRANGKAGYVYVISNLGSFGENVFKVGMTRRMNPQDRVDELGDASVPFKFDVHAMIFSDDAVGLEYKLHQELSSERLNKVNLRKEFFVTNIEKLRELVEEIDATAEFRETMVAQEYYRSIEMTAGGIIPDARIDYEEEVEEVVN